MEQCPRCNIKGYDLTWHANETCSYNMDAVSNREDPIKYWLRFDYSLINGRSVLISTELQEANMKCQSIWIEYNKPELLKPFMDAIKKRNDYLAELLANSDEKAKKFINDSWMHGNEIIKKYKGKHIVCVIAEGGYHKELIPIVMCEGQYHALICG